MSLHADLLDWDDDFCDNVDWDAVERDAQERVRQTSQSKGSQSRCSSAQGSQDPTQQPKPHLESTNTSSALPAISQLHASRRLSTSPAKPSLTNCSLAREQGTTACPPNQESQWTSCRLPHNGTTANHAPASGGHITHASIQHTGWRPQGADVQGIQQRYYGDAVQFSTQIHKAGTASGISQASQNPGSGFQGAGPSQIRSQSAKLPNLPQPSLQAAAPAAKRQAATSFRDLIHPYVATPTQSSIKVPGMEGIRLKANEFAQVMKRLPPPPPPKNRCPGVFKNGRQECGGILQFQIRFFDVHGRNTDQDMVSFYQCSEVNCDYREWLPQRKSQPLLSFEAMPPDAFKITAVQGAEEAVHYVGGLFAILTAAGLDLAKTTDSLEFCNHPDPRSVTEIQFELRAYEDVKARLANGKRLGMSLIDRDGPIPEGTLAAVRGCNWKRLDPGEAELLYKQIPKPLQGALMKFQEEGVRFGLARQGRVLIADEMGVGKTLQAIALACCYLEEWPLMVVVPASLRLVWAEELERWLPHLRPRSIHVIYGSKDWPPPPDKLKDWKTGHVKVVITSYEMLSRLTCEKCRDGGQHVKGGGNCTRSGGGTKCLATDGFKVVIIDESHYLRTTGGKDKDAKTTESAVLAAKRAKRVIMLSGTPSLSRPFDLFRQVDALRTGLLGKSREAFSRRYCSRKLRPVGQKEAPRMSYDNSGLSHGKELHSLLKKEVMLRRLKKDVMGQLPPKRRQVVRLPHVESMWTKLKRAHPGTKVEVSQSDDDDSEDDTEETHIEKMSAAHKLGLAKVESVKEWLSHVLKPQDNGFQSEEHESLFCQEFVDTALTRLSHYESVLVAYRDVMDQIAAALEGQYKNWEGVKYVRIDGSTDSLDRRTATHRFRDDPTISVALLSITAAGVGLDFSSATQVIFAELPDEVALLRQAEDRAHRKGQKKAVNVYFLVIRHPLEERRWQRLNNSLERVTAVHDGGDGETAGPGHDANGIHLDLVHDVVGTQGWDLARMTQLPPAEGHHREADLTEAGQKEEVEGSPASVKEPDAVAEALPSTTSANGETACTQVVGLNPGLASLMPQQAQASEEGNALSSKVCFEVSAHSGRVHFHLAPDGSQPLGLSLPVDTLLVPGVSSTLQDLLTALDSRSETSSHVGPAGVMAIPLHFSRADVEAMIAEARLFAAEWAELRAQQRNRMHGYCLRAPLKDIVEEVQSKAEKEGAYGSSTDRYLTAATLQSKLPTGAEWRTVRVKYYRGRQLKEHQQAFLNGERLCLLCMIPVTCSLSETAVLDGATNLFCGPSCELKFSRRTSGTALRRELFKLERGICQMCKLDCSALVKSLRVIQKGSQRWKETRQKILLRAAPGWAASKGKTASARLIQQCMDGHAWQADHVIPVFQGGGLCDVDNMRTLCTVCHAAVTKQQAKQRADARKAQNQPLIEPFVRGSKKRKASKAAAKDIPEVERSQRKLKRPPLKRAFLPMPSDEESG